MINLGRLLIYPIILTLTLMSCDNQKSFDVIESEVEKDEVSEKAVNDSIFKYKGSLIGDNSAIGAIINQLSIAEGYNGFQLFTIKDPYGLMINYNWQASEQQYQQTTAYYATYFFTLIQNADYVILNFSDQKYKVTKKDLIEWFGEDFTHIDNQADIDDFLMKNFDGDRVHELFQ